MKLTEEHYEILKQCRDNGKVYFCWDESQEIDPFALDLAKYDYIETIDEEHVIYYATTKVLKAFNAIITEKGKKALADYEQPQIDFKMRVESLSEQKEVKELMREVLSTTLRAEESARQANIENAKNKKWIVISAIAASVSALLAFVLLFC